MAFEKKESGRECPGSKSQAAEVGRTQDSPNLEGALRGRFLGGEDGGLRQVAESVLRDCVD